MARWKTYGIKRSWFNVRHFSSICLEVLRKFMKISGLLISVFKVDMGRVA